MVDLDAARREGALTANQLRELAEQPLTGAFDLAHLRAIHAYIFQDLPFNRPGELRADSYGWNKFRVLEGHAPSHNVHYAHQAIAGRAMDVLSGLKEPTGLAGLTSDAFASRMAQLYGDLDHIHPFHEGNSRTLREFTRSLALTAGYDLNWSPTAADVTSRNRLYIARDIAVLERAYPNLTPQRAMTTDDRAEYEAFMALTALRRNPDTSLTNIIRDGLTSLQPTHAADDSAATQQTSALHPKGQGPISRALATLRDIEGTNGTDYGSAATTQIVGRTPKSTPAEPSPAQRTEGEQEAAQRSKARTPTGPQSGPEP